VPVWLAGAPTTPIGFRGANSRGLVNGAGPGVGDRHVRSRQEGLFPETILTEGSSVLAVDPRAAGEAGKQEAERGRAVDLQIRIDGGTAEDYTALASRLNGNRDFRGRVRQVTGPPVDGSLDGGIVELLTVAVGSGGLGVALTRSLNTWLSTRQRHLTARVTVNPDGRTVELHARNPNTQELELLGNLLRDADEG
jgi:hypothetical protein